MVNKQLIEPESIVVVGASNNIAKPGGKLFHNIRTGTFRGNLYALNPKEDSIQGLPSYRDVKDLPDTDLAILAIPATGCRETIRELAETRNTRAFIIVSAGFSEEDEAGTEIENEIVQICKTYDAALIGPNCIGVMTPAYQGVFTLPIPRLDPQGCDFISGSGSTAVFIMEAGLQKGLKFNHVFSVGNSAQLGVEDVLQYFDETYREGSSSRVKLLYFETIKDPDKLLRHATSLIGKGCRIAAIKAGTTDAGSRAASSHTGAMASSDMAVDALFRKAGIVRCYGREELTTVASVMLHPPLKGRNLAIITHAGGSAVMLTDVLAGGDMDVPHLEGPEVDRLLTHLFPGSSASNPIDMLATGNAEQLGISIDFCESSFNEIDGIVVIFGTPGLAPVFDVYEVLHQKMQTCSKPIFPVLPSVSTAAEEVQDFLSHGHINFPDEVLFGQALTRIHNTEAPAGSKPCMDGINIKAIREVIEGAEDGFLSPEAVRQILDAGGIPRVKEGIAVDEASLAEVSRETGYPLVMKVVGPVHKSDVDGVALGIDNDIDLMDHFQRIKKIEGCTGVLLQPMLDGLELFAGAKYEPSFGHVILCGIGGIYVEVMKDFSSGLAPLSMTESCNMIRSLKGYKMLKGMRGQEGVDIQSYAEIIVRLSNLLRDATEIVELDLNPIMGKADQLAVVDARIRIEKSVV
ncbi:MAG: acetate--CoA ligase family protein [Bacteroidales bacterium]|nr:acetate--CoA ligase family protein [Bacteroidales bacterium]